MVQGVTSSNSDSPESAAKLSLASVTGRPPRFRFLSETCPSRSTPTAHY